MKTKLITAEEWQVEQGLTNLTSAEARMFADEIHRVQLNAAKWGMEQAADMAEAVGWRNERLVKRIREASNKLELPK